MEAAAVSARERSESLGASGEVKYKFRRGAQRTVQHIDAAHLKEGQRVFRALRTLPSSPPPTQFYVGLEERSEDFSILWTR
jgi:hypothetical protein